MRNLVAFFKVQPKIGRIVVGALFIATWVMGSVKPGGDSLLQTGGRSSSTAEDVARECDGAERPAMSEAQMSGGGVTPYGESVGRDGLVAPSSAIVATATARGDTRPPESDGRFCVFAHFATNDLAWSDGAELFDRWRLRGAADDAFRIAPPAWWFRLPDGFADGVTVFSRGEIRPDARTEYFPPIFTNRVSLLPQSRWHLIGADGESGVWHALTPSNSLLVGWANAALGRDPSTPTNAVVELFRDGRFAYRYADCTAERSPILPFDLDGDGLENSVDPDPLVAGRDAHGTNAEWHLAVCSNVFEAARGDARPSVDANGIFIPEGVAWREGVNTNAYYFVDVVAERGPAPVYFVADRESRLGSPVVVAMADETNRVPLLMGVKYAVTSEVPISVSVPADAELDAAGRDAPPYRSCISITRRSQGECDVEWPIGFTFTEAVSGSVRTYSVGVVPYDPGGDFEWGGDGGVATMSLASSVSCRCASGEGRTLSFACSSSCSCDGGCSVSGFYSLEGVYFAISGGTCRCGFDDEQETHFGDDQDGAATRPCLSISFGHSAVIFEDAYEYRPGAWKERRSTRTTLSVSASGGPYGGRLTLTTKGLERLSPVACGPLLLPSSVTLAPFEAYAAEFLCEAQAESDAADDVEVKGVFVEDETGETIEDGAALTAVRVELRATVEPPDSSFGGVGRHEYGVCEEVQVRQFPSTPAVSWVDSTPNGFSCVGTTTYKCPLQKCDNPLRAKCGGALYAPLLKIVEPESVYAEFLYGDSPESILLYGAKPGQAGGIGMLLNLYVLPKHVSFARIEIQEIPTFTYTPHGYFTNPYFNGLLGHTTEAGAGIWQKVHKADHLWSVDEAAYSGTIPWLTKNGRVTNAVECVWTDGKVYIDHPFGWRPQELKRVGNDEDWVCPFAENTRAEVTLDGNGTVGVRKLDCHVSRATNDVVWLAGKRFE